MRCPNCGNDNPDDYVFCDECGARLQPMAEAQEGGSLGAGSDAATASAGTEEGDSGMSSWQPASTEGDVSGSDSADQPSPYSGSGSDSGGMAPWDSTGSDASAGSGSEPWNVGGGSQDAEVDESVPVTEDTVEADQDTDNSGSGMSDEDSSQGGGLVMPGVVPMTDTYGSSGMGSSGSSGAGDADWAAAAQRYLVEAQRALDNLRRHLNSQPSGAGSGAAGGAYAQTDMSVGAPLGESSTGMASEMGSMEAGPSAGMDAAGGYGSGMGAAESEYPSGGFGSMSGGESSGSVDESPMISSEPYGAPDMSGAAGGEMGSIGFEPEAEAVTPGAMGDMGMGADAATSMEAAPYSATDMASSPVSQVGDEPMMARLVLIATGAEMPLPNQEEITVGREDPSSGIFPDVDLTPYGGEDGGVSRRHAKILRIGDDFFVEDLQSTNYTKLDGQRLNPNTRERLEDGARLDFGRVATIFRRS